MVMSLRNYNADRADEKRSEAARRGSVTRENRAKAYSAWRKKWMREHNGREPEPADRMAAIDRIKREVIR